MTAGKCSSKRMLAPVRIARSCISPTGVSHDRTDFAAAPTHDRRHELRNMSPLTQASYVRAVKNFSKHFGKSPDKLSFEDVRDYQLHSGVSRPRACRRSIRSCVRFGSSTGRRSGMKEAADHIPLARRADTLPAVLSREEVARFLQGGSQHQAQDGICDDLCGRFAHLRGDAAHGAGYRQRPHGDLRAAGQRTQGPLYRSCPSSCSAFFATTGGRRGHRTGCFPAAIRPGR